MESILPILIPAITLGLVAVATKALFKGILPKKVTTDGFVVAFVVLITTAQVLFVGISALSGASPVAVLVSAVVSLAVALGLARVPAIKKHLSVKD